MQKVEGSSPFIRFAESRWKRRLLLAIFREADARAWLALGHEGTAA